MTAWNPTATACERCRKAMAHDLALSAGAKLPAGATFTRPSGWTDADECEFMAHEVDRALETLKDRLDREARRTRCHCGYGWERDEMGIPR